MKRITVVALAVAAVVVTFASAARAANRPANRVVAMYFHRTQRCPTCLKMGGYSEEAVKTGFAQQIEEGTVEFHYVDFQNRKNAALARGYKVSGPSLIVAKIVQNRVKEYKNLEEIWTKVQDKSEFIKYVRENVAAYLQ